MVNGSNKMKLHPLLLNHINVAVTYAFVNSPPAQYDRDILVIQYHGYYPDGCEGNSDASYMYAMGMAGVHRFDPSAVLLDMTKLEYHWGDQLERVFDVGIYSHNHTAVAVGPKCIKAIGTLLEGFDEPETSLLKRKDVFDNMNEAVAYLISDALGNKYKDFLDAVKSNDFERVKKMLANGLDVRAMNGDGGSAIWHVKSVEMAVLLVQAGADINDRNSLDMVPLHNQQDLDIVSYLISQGADADVRDQYNRSPLNWSDSVELSRLLVDEGADIRRMDRDTLLHSHQILRNYELTEFYVETGLNINIQDKYNKTPLDIIDYELALFSKGRYVGNNLDVTENNLKKVREFLVANGAIHANQDYDSA